MVVQSRIGARTHVHRTPPDGPPHLCTESRAMTPRPPPSAEHFTQVVTEVDRLVQQGCAEISALSRMALLWLETPETSNRLDVDRKSTRLNSSHLVISYAVF